MNVTVEDFKGYFTRNFPYLPIWQADKVYNTGDVYYYNNLFYESQTDNNSEEPIIEGELSSNWQKIWMI